MARFALAWELGGGLGHAMPLAQLAQTLIARGHEVHLVWKDLSLVGTILGAPAIDRQHVWQAPLHLHRQPGAAGAVSYAELLLEAGYVDVAAVRVVVRAWRQLLVAIQPDLLIADHAPSALIASRGLSFARVMFGNGFLIPPACHPMPAFREWESTSSQRLASADERALLACNELLASIGQPPLNELHELMAVDDHILLGWPELDHYRRDRLGRPMHSWGWPKVPTIGVQPAWPAARGPRLLAYLTRDHPARDAALACLRAGPWCTLLIMLGATDQDVRDSSNSQLQIVNQPVDMALALDAAQLLLSHSGSGLLYQAMTAGLPAVLLPTQIEQLLLARRVAAAGAGIVVWPHEVEQSLSQAIEAVLGSSGFAAAARRLATRNSADVHGDVLARIAGRCEQLSEPGR